MTAIFSILSIWGAIIVYVGITYRNDCQVQYKIPIWLIVYGLLGIFIFILKVIDNIVGLKRYKLRYFILF